MKKSLNHLFNYVSIHNQCYQTGSGGKFLNMSCRKEYFANSCFPCAVNEWNNLSPEICKSVSHEVFIYLFMNFISVLKSNFLLNYV